MIEFEERLAAAWPMARWHDVTALVAVSGGADSVALVRGLAALGATGLPAATAGAVAPGRLIVAHYNHALRGAASDADERFVVALAGQLNLECHTGRAAVADCCAPPLSTNAASEEYSRAARYEFLATTAQRLGARYVVTAHTADDQAETVLHHVVRGTGLAGLAGMRRARELAPGLALVRPLLSRRRSEVLAYLAEIGQSYCEDATNLDLSYTRNRLRHELLPRLAAEYNPRIVDALVRLGALAADGQEVIEAQAAELLNRALVEAAARRIFLDVAPLAAAPLYLVREALIAAWRAQNWPLQGMGYDEWELLAALAMSPAPAATRSTKRVLPGEIVAERAGDRLLLSRASG